MRDSLTVLAILLICLLTAATVGPYLIDWNSHRVLIEAKLSEAAGTPIRIAGPIKVRLLPQPKFRLGHVTIGTASAGAQSLTAEELDVDISFTALLRGELQVGEAALHAPRLELSAGPDGAFRLDTGFGDAKRVQVQHVAVTDGAVVVARPGRAPLTLSGLDFDGEAASLLGPFKATGRFGPAGDQHPFKLSTGTSENGSLRVKLALEATGTLPAVEFDGRASLADPAPQTAAPFRLAGTLTLKDEIPLEGTPATIPWTLTGRVDVDDAKASVAGLEFRAGGDLRAINATGDGEVSLSPDLHARLRLHGPQLNLDRLAVSPDPSSVAAPTGLALLSRLNGRVGQGSRLGFPLRLDIDYGFDTVSTGPLTVLGIAGQLGLDGGKLARARLTANGPDAARVTLDGGFEAGAAPVFRGRLEASSRDLPRLAEWFAPVLPDASAWIKANVPVRSIGFAGNVDLSGVGVAARDAVLNLDRSELAGTLTYTRPVGDARARLFADLTSEALDIDDLPDPGALAGGWNDVDLDVALAARAIKVVPAGVGVVDAGRIGLRLHKSVSETVLDTFSADLGSARMTATGRLDAHAAMLDAHVDAPQLDAVAALLARLLPGSSTAWLSARAPALSPAQLDLGLRATRARDGSLLPTGVTLEGVMNGSRVKAGLDPDTPGDLDPATSIFTINLDAEAPQGSVLLRQVGVPTAGTENARALGAGRLKGKAHGSVAEGFVASVDAGLGGAALSFQGRTKLDQGSGHLTVRGKDITPLLRSSGIALSLGSAAWPAEVDADLVWHGTSLALRHLRGTAGSASFSGDLDATLAPAADKPALFGTLALDRLAVSNLLDAALGPAPPEAAATHDAPAAWAHGAFGPPLMQWPRSAVAVKLKTLTLRDGLEARDASFTLRAARGALTLADFTAKLNAGQVSGALTLRRDGPAAAVSGTASWSGIGLDWPGLAGKTGGTLDFAGGGDSPAALVASLAGTGSVSVSDGRIAGLDPGALTRTAMAAERGTSDIDTDQIRATLEPELQRGPLRFRDVSGQATLASGVFRLGPMRVAGDDWTADADATIDLRDFGFASKTVLALRQPLPNWKGDPPQVTLLLRGSLEAPRRELDAAAFVNALQLRAIARDQERIDVMQQDIRERAFFNRRRKAIEAEQAAAREKTEGADEILRQMRQNQENSRDLAPGPPPRPTGLPGSKPATSAPPRPSRSPASKPVPGTASGGRSPPGGADPASAAR